MSQTSLITTISPKQCRPFILEVFVVSPEAGYKFELLVEKACSADNDPLWKLVFDLYKRGAGGEFEQIVHVSFRAVDPKEQQGVQNLSVNPVSVATARVLVQEVHPAAKAVAGVSDPTPAQKQAVHDAMSKAAVSAIWPTTSTRVMTLARRLLFPRPPSFIMAAEFPRALSHAGINPERRVATRVIPTVTRRTLPSIVNETQ